MPSLPYRITRGGALDSGLLPQLVVHATRRDVEDDEAAQISRTVERSDLSYIGTKRRQTSSDRELKQRFGRWNKQAMTEAEQSSYWLSTSAKRFSFYATIHIPVMRGKKIDSGLRLNSAKRGARAAWGGGRQRRKSARERDFFSHAHTTWGKAHLI
jgi:hypothetical protein